MEIEKNVYVTALRVLVKMGGLNPHQSELFVYSDTSYLDFIFPKNIEGKEMVFINHENQGWYIEQYDKGIEILEIEPAKENEDELIVKINHYHCALTDLPLNEEKWKKKLTIKESILRDTQVETLNSISLSASHQTTWTYIKFKFNNELKRFVVTNIETKES